MYTFNHVKEEFAHATDSDKSVPATTQQVYSLIQSGELSKEEFEQWIVFIRNKSFDSGYSAVFEDECLYD
jgi:hypothetical protein